MRQKPFLKWAGNKYRIVPQIKAILEQLPAHQQYIEPFVGSAAVFLNTSYSQAILADTNADLIHLYRILQREGPAFIEYCHSFFTAGNNCPDKYYEFRNLFNTTDDVTLKSALFLYLNRHCFNGLCRYNSQGGFNVPFGRYKKPYFPEEEMRWFFQKSQSAVFEVNDFQSVLKQASFGDVVYCDPPYVPLSGTANFTSYSQGGFSLAEQQILADFAAELAQQGTFVLVSNHKTPLTQALYQPAEILELEVQRFISCQGNKRGKATEVLALFRSTMDSKRRPLKKLSAAGKC